MFTLFFITEFLRDINPRFLADDRVYKKEFAVRALEKMKN